MFLICFLAGVANVAMQKAVLESGHPFVDQMKRHFGAMVSERFSLVLDTLLIAAVLLFVWRGEHVAGWLYLGYTGFNGMAAWAILNDRL